MKAVLRGMLSAGQYVEAQTVISQLVPLLPEDLELLKLQQELLFKTGE